MPRSIRWCFVVMFAATALIPVARADAGEDTYWKSAQECFGGQFPNSHADVIVRVGDDIYVGGYFDHIGELPVNGIARWDGKQWHALGTGVRSIGMTSVVHSMFVMGNRLYVAGMFDIAGDLPASNIAAWELDRRRWLPLAGGTDRAIRGVAATPDGKIYIVGEFTMADDRPAQGVAMWDGTGWRDMNGSLNPRARARAVAVDGNNVYIGGYFSTAGGVDVNNIARWDGSQWHSLGGGTDNLVSTIGVRNGIVYAGGPFTKAGGVAAAAIARWDGHGWSPLGAGLTGAGATLIHNIFIEDDRVHVGGTFSLAGGAPASHVATWRAGAWTSLGGGTDDQVKMIRRFGDELYVVGNFSSAGGRAVNRLAVWNKDVLDIRDFRATRMHDEVMVEWDVESVGPIEAYRVYRARVDDPEDMRIVERPAMERSFLDRTAEMNVEYDYWLGVQRESGREATSAPMRVQMVPDATTLAQNFPNPFNPRTTIAFSVAAPGPVALRVYDVGGRLVRTLVDEWREAGPYSETWDGLTDGGARAGTGVYFYRLDAAGRELSQKMMLVK